MGGAGQVRYVIGLTGNIACGKSQVARILAALGARVIDADRVAHAVMRPGTPVHSEIVCRFGPEILAGDGSVDRTKLGALVFADPQAMAALEGLVHPATLAEVERQISDTTEPVVVVEAIKLIESGMHARHDALWVVTAPRQAQIDRLMRDRRLSVEEATLRIDAQPPQAEKAVLADVVLHNDGDLVDLQAQVEAAWAAIPT
jgi:dephospho-CoA kinase